MKNSLGPEILKGSFEIRNSINNSKFTLLNKNQSQASFKIIWTQGRNLTLSIRVANRINIIFKIYFNKKTKIYIAQNIHYLIS